MLSIYRSEANIFFFSIIKQEKSFDRLSSFDRMRYLMTNQDPIIVQSTMRYVTDLKNRRELILKLKTDNLCCPRIGPVFIRT